MKFIELFDKKTYGYTSVRSHSHNLRDLPECIFQIINVIKNIDDFTYSNVKINYHKDNTIKIIYSIFENNSLKDILIINLFKDIFKAHKEIYDNSFCSITLSLDDANRLITEFENEYKIIINTNKYNI